MSILSDAKPCWRETQEDDSNAKDPVCGRKLFEQKYSPAAHKVLGTTADSEGARVDRPALRCLAENSL